MERTTSSAGLALALLVSGLFVACEGRSHQEPLRAPPPPPISTETPDLRSRNRAQYELSAQSGRSGLGDTIQQPAPGSSGNPAYVETPEPRALPTYVDPASTFSIDVDTASYTNVRGMIESGRTPPPGAVRIEEMLNYFTYGDARSSEVVSVSTELGENPWAPGHALAKVVIRGRSIEGPIPPRNLVMLVDVSGSMSPDDRLPRVRRALARLAETLRPQDRLAIVAYAGAEGVVLETTRGSERGRILRALESLESGGSTNGGAGIRLAYSLGRSAFVEGGINRVVLATDGDFNVGVTNHDELVRLIEAERRSGIELTILGVGTDNFRDHTMEALADHGNGNYAFLDSEAEAYRVLVSEADATLVTVARDVKVEVRFDAARVASHRLVGYENRVMTAEEFQDPRTDAGELGAGDSVVALYDLVLANRDEDEGSLRRFVPRFIRGESSIARIEVRYIDATSGRRNETFASIGGEVRELDETTDDFRFASGVAAFGLALRNSESADRASFELARSLASSAIGDDHDGERRDFIRLIDRARGFRAL